MGLILSFAGGGSRTKSWGGGWWCCGLGAGGLCFCWRVCFFRVAVVLLPFLLLGVVAACAGALGLLAPFRAAFLSGARRLRVLCSFRGASWAARLRFFLARLRFFWRGLWAGRLRFLWAGGAGGWLRFFLGRAAGGAAAFFLAGRCVSVFFCSGGAPALFSGVRRWRCVCVFFWRVSRAVCLRFLSWRVVRLGFFLARAAGGAPAFFLGGRRACFFFWAGGAAAFFSGVRRGGASAFFLGGRCVGVFLGGRRVCFFFWRAPRASRLRFFLARVAGCVSAIFFWLGCASAFLLARDARGAAALFWVGGASAFFSGRAARLRFFLARAAGGALAFLSGARRGGASAFFLGGRCVCVFLGGRPVWFFSGARRPRRVCVFFCGGLRAAVLFWVGRALDFFLALAGAAGGAFLPGRSFLFAGAGGRYGCAFFSWSLAVSRLCEILLGFLSGVRLRVSIRDRRSKVSDS